MVGGALGVVLGSLATFGLIAWIVIAVLNTIGCWKIYNKFGEPGWKCLIPVYGTWVEYKYAWKPQMAIAAWVLSFGGEWLKQKAHIADWMYRETLCFFLEHQRMPEAEEFESLCQTVYVKVRSANYRVAYDEIRLLYAKRLDSYSKRIQRDAEAGITLEALAKQPKQKKTGKAPGPRKKRELPEPECWQDENFFFIAGYTSGGAPYGVTWEEMDESAFRAMMERGLSEAKADKSRAATDVFADLKREMQ